MDRGGLLVEFINLGVGERDWVYFTDRPMRFKLLPDDEKRFTAMDKINAKAKVTKDKVRGRPLAPKSTY